MDQLGDMREVFARAGAMRPLLERLDWRATALGAPASWPQSLRSAASICLEAKYPIAIYWGSELTLVYNDAWSQIPQDRHPWALGRSGREVWTDIWDIVGPQFEAALTGTGMWTEDALLPMVRHGRLEETYFNYNISPITGEDGRIEGVFNGGLETSQRVLSERRNRLLIAVTAGAALATTVADACSLAADALAADSDTVPFALLYLFDTPGSARLAASAAVEPDTAVSPTVVALRGEDPDPWRLDEVRRSRSRVRIDDLETVVGSMPSGSWTEPPHTAVTLPIVLGRASSRRNVFGALVLGVPAGRPVDDAMLRFFDLLTEHLASALLNARLDEEERHAFLTEHQIATTLQQSLIPDLPDVPGVELHGRYLPGSAEVDVGGDWYDAVSLPDGRIAIVIGDVVGKGVAAAAQMGQLRNAMRAYLLEGFSPAEVIRKLNHLTISLSGTSFATVLCMFHDPRTRSLEWCRAGHLPALVRGIDGSTRFLDGGGSPPIAVFSDAAFSDASTVLAPGEMVVLYTDGLVERRGEDLDAGLGRLADVVADLDPRNIDVDDLIAPLLADERRDDVAVLLLGVPST